jgi:hypothetical protein
VFSNGAFTVGFKHSARIEDRLSQARKVLAKSTDFWGTFQDEARRMIEHEVNDKQSEEYFLSLFPGDATKTVNIRNKCFDLYKEHKSPTCTNRVFGLLMAVQTYAERWKVVRKSKKRNEVEAAIEATLTGDVARIKSTAYATAIKFMHHL